MLKRWAYTPGWEWWVRTGDRMTLGLSSLTILEPRGPLKQRVRLGLLRVSEGVRAGQPVVASMKHSGMRLPPEIWCLLETAEHTGRLGEGMKETGELLKASQLRKREIVGQLWYPLLLIMVGGAVMGLILVWVIPQLKILSQDMGLGEDLPWITEHIGRLYGSIVSLMLLGLIFATSAIFSLRRLGKSFYRPAGIEESVLSRIPVAGKVRRRLREAGLLRQLGTLIHGGVTFPEALEMASGTVANKWASRELMQFRQRLLMGASFPDALEACPLLSQSTCELLLSGQETGKLDEYMMRVSSDLQRQVTWTLENGIRLLEPTMLLLLACAIGGLLLAYMLPMVRMLEQAGGAF